MKAEVLNTVYVDMLVREIAKLKTLPAGALDKFAASGKTVIHTGNYPEDMIAPDLAGGWKTVIRRNRDGASKLVLKSGDKRTGGILHEGQVKFATDAGLTPEQAVVWVKAAVGYKHDTIEELVKVMKDPMLVKAYLDVPTKNKDADGRTIPATKDQWNEWLAKYEIKDFVKFNLREKIGDMVNYLTMPPEMTAAMINGESLGLSAELMALVIDADLPAESEVADEALDATRNGNGVTYPAGEPVVN